MTNQTLNSASDATAIADGLKLLSELDGLSRAAIGRRALRHELQLNSKRLLKSLPDHYDQRASALRELLR